MVVFLHTPEFIMLVTTLIVLVLGFLFSAAVLVLGFTLGLIYAQNTTTPTETKPAAKPAATEPSPSEKAAARRGWTVGVWTVLAAQDPDRWEKLKERIAYTPPEVNLPFEEANHMIDSHVITSKKAGKTPPTVAELMQAIRQ